VVLCFIVFLCASPSSELVVFDPGKWLYRTRSEGLTGYSCLSVLLPLRVRLGHLSWNNSGGSATCPVYTGLSGASAEQRLLRANGHLQAHLMRARSAQKSGTRALAHRTLNSTCPVCTGHPGRPRSQNSYGQIPTALVTWLAHRTVRCTIRQTTSTNSHVWWLGL
jgi:hypothetical protein